MRRVNRPNFGAMEVFTKCIGRIRDRELKNRLEGVRDHIENEAATYAGHAANAELHLVQQTENVCGVVSIDEMVAIYDQRLAGKKGPGRHIYDAIKLMPKHGICPFCDHRTVSTLDHLLPKRLFPSLSVTPDNLVGACADCNKAKLAFAPNSEEDAILHPYFEVIEERPWLSARVVEGSVAAVIFRTQLVPEWSDALNERIRRQFQMLQLSQLYGAQAAREISSQSLLLEKIHNSRGQEGVREELQKQAETHEAFHLNSWQAVTYRALSNSEWFCDGGFSS